ncbi:amidohydrolase family protein [Hyalangium versicolor]|uniref:amidohydrolase family protein n=1 Tax=Hyalangium versicolor TaxID=2861190 RepID=UPI001CCE4A63|nr:amidohydrolase family protein [Hyalangium versicolor]
MKRLSSILLMLVLAGCATTQSLEAAESTEPSFAIRNVRIFDGERVIPSGTIVVRGERIAAVGENLNLSGVTEIIDGQGMTVLPGLIDAHFHLQGPDSYKAALAFGVTTVIDMFGEYSAAAIKTTLTGLAHRAPDEADTLVSLLVTAPKGHGTEYGEFPMPQVTSAKECQEAVDNQLAAGASFVKIIYDAGESWSAQTLPTFGRDVLAACIAAAHAHGVVAVVHAITLRESREAIEAGADGLTHAIVNTRSDPAFAELVSSHKAFVIPTLAVYAGIAGFHNDAAILGDPRLEAYLPPSGLSGLKMTFPPGFGQGVKPALMQENVRQLKASHVPLLAGSDCANPGTAVGATLHQELEMLVSTALTPTEALTAATALPADRFKLSDRGHLAPGLRADLLLVRGDPTTDIQVTRNIISVWKLGKKLDRDTYRAHIQAERQATAKQ